MMLNVPTCGGGYYFNNFKHENMMRLGSPSTFSYFLVLNIRTPKIRSRCIFQFQYIPFSIHYRDTLSNKSINMKIMHVFMISLHWSLVFDVYLMTAVVLKHQRP